jgi:hypothetical protein
MDNPRRFLPSDYEVLKAWTEEHEMQAPDFELLPETGFIVDNVACGFIYLTNSKLAILEGFVTNPKSNKDTRNDALDDITLELMQIAKKSGYKVLKCETRLNAIVKRAEKFGFKEIGIFKTLIKEIREI